MQRKTRGIRGLRHIKTACGTRKPNASRSLSMIRQPRRRPQQQRQQSFKARSFTPPQLFQLCIQRLCKPVSKLSQKDNCVNVQILLPPNAAESIQIDIQGDILIVKAKTENIQYHTECLLPFEVQPSIKHFYRDGTLHIDLKARV